VAVIALFGISAYLALRPTPTVPTYSPLYSGALVSNHTENSSNGEPCTVVLHCYSEAYANFSVPTSASHPVLWISPVTLRIQVAVTSGPQDCTPSVRNSCEYYIVVTCPVFPLQPQEWVPTSRVVYLPNDNGSYSLPCTVGPAMFVIVLYGGSPASPAESFTATAAIAVLND